MATGSNISSDTCSICTEHFNQPKLLPCFHTFCLECLQQFVSSSSKDGQFLCPLCRYQVTLPEVGVTGFQTNFYIEARAEKQGHSGGECCGVCEQRATHSCRECEIMLCDTCTKGHRIVPVSRSHLLINLSDSSTEKTFLSKQTFCEKHKDEKLRFYCLPCSKMICRDCKHTNHEGHKTKDIADVVEEARTSLTKTKVELEMFKAKIEKSIGNINENSTNMSKHIKDVKEEINKLADSLVVMINKARRIEIDRVTDIDKTHEKKYSDEQCRLTQRKCFLQSQIDRTDAMLKDGLECDVLTADSEMKQRLAEIQKEQQLDSDFDSKSLNISDIPPVTPGVLDVVRCAVRNVMTHVFPISRKPTSLKVLETFFDAGSTVHSICLTKSLNILSVQGKDCHVCLFKESLSPILTFRVSLDKVISEGVHGVIEKHNKDNPDNKIPADDYTNLKKPFPYKDTNNNGDTCWVIKEHNWVGIQTASGDIRTLTFNPFAEPGQEFRPLDVCWGNNQEVYIVDGETHMIIVYSLQGGFQNSIITTNEMYDLTPTAVAMNTNGNLVVGDAYGVISIYRID
ncbi:E3 ubiquitin-protein ligase TRIM56-like [Gigantopelta aegis]|uniref:E3 ubiquitin-protein ligase TRIM56-like n=1 Tax=Gigantopelta aegis TaxID=1735272 RepID=UPI001B88AF40|nr:E3 ubiquitin-protein ligase TRIM56-like [Gigantopelta aegis]